MVVLKNINVKKMALKKCAVGEEEEGGASSHKLCSRS